MIDQALSGLIHCEPDRDLLRCSYSLQVHSVLTLREALYTSENDYT